jgi:hypothetical protein
MFPGPPILAISGSFEDTLADILSWVVFIIVPVLAIGLFWMVHILPYARVGTRAFAEVESLWHRKSICAIRSATSPRSRAMPRRPFGWHASGSMSARSRWRSYCSSRRNS